MVKQLLVQFCKKGLWLKFRGLRFDRKAITCFFLQSTLPYTLYYLKYDVGALHRKSFFCDDCRDLTAYRLLFRGTNLRKKLLDKLD